MPDFKVDYTKNMGVKKISSIPSSISPKEPKTITPGEHNLNVLDKAIGIATGVNPSTIYEKGKSFFSNVSKGVDRLKEKAKEGYDYYTNPNISTEEKVGKTVLEIGKGAIGAGAFGMKDYHSKRSDMKRTEATLMKIKAYKNK